MTASKHRAAKPTTASFAAIAVAATRRWRVALVPPSALPPGDRDRALAGVHGRRRRSVPRAELQRTARRCSSSSAAIVAHRSAARGGRRRCSLAVARVLLLLIAALGRRLGADRPIVGIAARWSCSRWFASRSRWLVVAPALAGRAPALTPPARRRERDAHLDAPARRHRRRRAAAARAAAAPAWPRSGPSSRSSARRRTALEAVDRSPSSIGPTSSSSTSACRA